MKKTLITLLLLCAAGTVHATLIPLTRYPYYYGYRHSFFDEALPSGWVSKYGILDGKTFFFTDLIGSNPGTTANISWDFSTLPGWRMTRILVVGQHTERFFQVGHSFQFRDLGELVTSPDGTNLWSIGFYGKTPITPVPDTGSTIGLFLVGLLTLLGFLRYSDTRSTL